jgi:DNA-binding transcriptional LysR family regulator
MRGAQFADLNVFVAVADQASFTKAARLLGLSTATLSQTVRALETRLGVRLLNRTTRSVAPTDAGERLLTQLRPLLDGFDAAIESVNAFREKPAGHLRLTMPPPVARFVLAPVLARFLQQYPEIVIETTVESGLTDIVAGRYDAGLRRGNLVARDMIATRVTNDMHYLVVASPDYVARRGRPQTPADLYAHNCIRYRLPGGGFIPWVFVVDGKTVEFDVEGSVIVINDPDLVTAPHSKASASPISTKTMLLRWWQTGVWSVCWTNPSRQSRTDSFCSIRAAGRTRPRSAHSLNFCGRSCGRSTLRSLI